MELTGPQDWTQVDGTRLQSVLQTSYIRKHNPPTRYQSITYRRLFAPDISENPRVASSILAPAIENQRLTRFWVVADRSASVVREGGQRWPPFAVVWTTSSGGTLGR